MAEIRTKAEFYRRWHAGLLGNRPRTWSSPAKLAASGWAGRVGIRSAQKGGPCLCHLSVYQALMFAETWPCTPTFSEAMPDDLLLLQGEVARLPGGLHLTYSTVRGLTMRKALRRPQRAAGLEAKLLLDRCLWPSSRDDLAALLDLYPDAVIEFGVHDCAVGVLPNRNAVVWEVRNY